LLTIATASATAALGSLYLLYRQTAVKADGEVVVQGSESDTPHSEPAQEKEEEEDDNPKKKHVSLHDRHFIAYENRVRAYSTPDKIFRYFATLEIQEGEGRGKEDTHIYMTPEDFLRSITPGVIQPENLGLDRFRTVHIDQWKRERSEVMVDEGSVFTRLGHDGLISFSDYLFLLTIISTPMKHFEIAFKMFDLNGDGEVDYNEFDKVRDVILSSTSVGARHRDHLVTGNVAGGVGDALVEHFFGADKQGKLTVEMFGTFHRLLRTELLWLEFNRFDPQDGRITERDFARMILSYADINDQQKKKYRKRVKKVYEEDSQEGITFEDVQAFTELVENISDVEMALSMYMAAGASITPADLRQVALAVAGIELHDRLVKMIFALFDENMDGSLSHKEFIRAMKSRTTRGLEKSKNTGFTKLIASCYGCTVKVIKDQLGLSS
jgi:Ca2+-binding EF-hand superfamily protein